MPKIFHRVGIEASPEEVYQALTTQEGLSSWWTRQTIAKPEVGAKLDFRFDDRSAQFQVLELVPTTQVKWRCLSGPQDWLGSEITFDIKKENDETVLLFDHRWDKTTEFMGHSSLKWAYFLLSLKSLLEDGAGTPYPEDRKISRWDR